MSEATQSRRRKPALVAVILIVVTAAVGGTYFYMGMTPHRQSTSTIPENVREDLALRKDAVQVGLTFLWASDVADDAESNIELKQLIHQVNEVFDPVQVYFWLYRSAVLTKTSVEVYQGLPVEANCTLEISDEIHNMFSASDIPIIVVRDIPDKGTDGLTCSFPKPCFDWGCPEEYLVQESYIILDLETMRSTVGYRILTHEILHILLKVPPLPPEPEWVVYGTFPVDDLSYTVIVSDYKRIREAALEFHVEMPGDYDPFG
jgi:hypothetical protein